MEYLFYRYMYILLWPALIIGLIVFFMARRRKRAHPTKDREWYLQLALSKEDAVSQLFLMLSFFFLGVTMLSFNKDFGEPLTWRAILLIASLIGLVGAYYFKTIYTLIFSLIGLVGWWGAEASLWMDAKDIKSSALFAGLSLIALLFYALGHLHEKQIKFKRFALLYSVLGIVAVTGTLFFFSTRAGLGVLGEMTKGASFVASWELTMSLLIFLVVLIGAALYSAVQRLLSPFELLAILALAGLFIFTAFLPEQKMFGGTGLRPYQPLYYGGSTLSSTGVMWALVYNAAVFFELLGLIFSGYVRRETWLINLGALFLFLLIIVKYFDWFFTFLDKSIFFIGAGILLFVVGWFMEKGRRYMISNIKVQMPQTPQ